MGSNGTAAGEVGRQLRLRTPSGRWVLLATVLGSGVAMLDTTVVNVALPTIGRQFDATIGGLQWIINAYTLTLAALILLGGSLGDRFGRRRVFIIGVVWFAVASVLCGLAPNAATLIAFRALQGVGGALLTPGSLAIISASFAPADRAAAIGAWSGLGGIAAAVGPFLGGWLVGIADWTWRLAFGINAPVAALVVWVALRHVPESLDPTAARRLDLAGAALGAAGLAGLTYGLIRGGERGMGSPTVLAAIAVGVLAIAAFVAVERRSSHPMLPLDVFASRQFTAANIVTLVVYGALGAALFLLALHVQVVLGYSPLQAGVALLPITVVLLALSSWAGRLAQRVGPRLPMTFGPLGAGAGLALLTRAAQGGSYVAAVLPGLVVFALGLALTVAPLTAAVLAAAETRHAGVASGVNNAFARAAGLLAVAVIPVAAGLTGESYNSPAVFGAGFRTGMLISAALCAAGGVLAFATISNALRGDRLAQADHHITDSHCSLQGPPLRSPARSAP